jgi:hypothetical protein
MKINTLLLATLLSTSMTLASEINTTTPEMTVKQEGIKYIKMLGGTLKTELQKEMKADKTGVGAVTFCTTKATKITAEVNSKLPAYAKVRRTALKLRNAEKNSADVLDTKIMQEYVASIEAKTFTPKDIKVVKDGDITRVYKPLLAKPVCLICHGSKISTAIQEEITKGYPHDKAVNFEENSLRGVIVAEIKKH